MPAGHRTTLLVLALAAAAIIPTTVIGLVGWAADVWPVCIDGTIAPVDVSAPQARGRGHTAHPST